MKTKNLKKKLVFSKATVANLDNSEMKALKGGDSVPTGKDLVTSCGCSNHNIICIDGRN